MAARLRQAVARQKATDQYYRQAASYQRSNPRLLMLRGVHTWSRKNKCSMC